MNLRHIKQDVCPDCGSPIFSESREPRNHSNGDSFETRTFACGRILEWSPNFQKLLTRGKCTKCPAFKQEEEKRKAAAEAIKEFILKLDVDEIYKKILLSELPTP